MKRLPLTSSNVATGTAYCQFDWQLKGDLPSYSWDLFSAPQALCTQSLTSTLLVIVCAYRYSHYTQHSCRSQL